MKRHQGKTVAITGAATGIGRVLATRFAEEGANVVIIDLRGAEEAATEFVSAGHSAIGLQADIANEVDTMRWAAAARARFGSVDILVNNAALFSTLKNRPFDEIPAEEWRRVMEVNTLGPFLCLKAVVGDMKQRQWGRIVNIASTAAIKGVPNFAHYVSSKGALIAFTRAIARELGSWNVTSNAIAPGLTLSDQVLKNEAHVNSLQEVSRKARSIQRDAYPSDLAGTVSFLASDDAAFISGQTICVDGGAVFL
ncbi:MAG: SDR family NAD(P)-dependent oxidoreductase [Betaproteobacteria bacterium]|jgi:NAD(P)-dependent dehydrogenase (short-subunit alcohol dehydrogenase family)